MKWYPKFPKQGTTKVVEKFAWLPKKIRTGDLDCEYYWIWLEKYKSEYYCELSYSLFSDRCVPTWVKNRDDYQTKP